MSDRVTIISSDTHAGGAIMDYRPYLEERWLDDFDAWRAKYDNPFRDLTVGTKNRNYDNERRTTEQYADGVVAEVVFPNTVPPFFPTGQAIAGPPSERSYERRLAGVRAHNRWLKDFCAVTPGQRAGLPQIFLNHIEDAIADVEWAAANGFRSILLPHVPPDAGLPGFFSDAYDPLWSVCQDNDIVLTQHSGTGIPSYGGSNATAFLMLMEVSFYAQKSFWHLILTGVFHRFPRLKHVMTEQGVAWVPPTLARMDHFWHQMKNTGRVGELAFEVDEFMPNQPSDYFQQNCWIGASFPAPSDALAIRELGADKVMWGSDYPHDEGTYPMSRESLRHSFVGFSDDDLRAVLGGNAAGLYGFDLKSLAPLAAEHGPTLTELREPLATVPDHQSPAFTRG